jgi:hypothetical protein
MLRDMENSSALRLAAASLFLSDLFQRSFASSDHFGARALATRDAICTVHLLQCRFVSLLLLTLAFAIVLILVFTTAWYPEQ